MKKQPFLTPVGAKSLLIITLCLISSCLFAQQKKTTPAKPKASLNQTSNKTTDQQTSKDVQNIIAKQAARKSFVEDSTKNAQLVQKQKEDHARDLQAQYDAMHSTPKASTDKKAQTQKTGAKIWIGLRGAGLATSVVSQPATDKALYSDGFAYAGGLVANFGLGKHLSLQSEALYQQDVVHYSVLGSNSLRQFSTSKLNTIQVPILLKYSFGAYNRGFFINTGIYGSYYLNSTTINDYSLYPNTYTPEETAIFYGVVGGLGFGLPINKGRLVLELRSTYNLGNTNSNFNTDVSYITTTASVAYLFPLGR